MNTGILPVNAFEQLPSAGLSVSGGLDQLSVFPGLALLGNRKYSSYPDFP